MKHIGQCHCGRVKFEVEMTIENAISCNCSICMKRGSLLDFVPESKFRLLSCASELQEYLFNKKVIHHYFCKNCGILPFGMGTAPDGSKVVAINLRCIDGVELKALKVHEYDGRSL